MAGKKRRVTAVVHVIVPSEYLDAVDRTAGREGLRRADIVRRLLRDHAAADAKREAT
jgi:hypothetical protein